MRDPRALAAAYGVRVELADLGDWGATRLIAEYDPDGPTIRINERRLPAAEHREGVIAFAIAHELYHHREAIGEIARAGGRAAREAAADAYAAVLVSAR